MTEPTPWPRAKRMSYVVVGERVQPCHLQVIAEYDEARGETTPRHHGPSMYTAAHINQAIDWWNKRAELEAAIAPGPMSDERLAEIRAASRQVEDGQRWDRDDAIDAFGYVRELLAEVDRTRALGTPVSVTLPADAVMPDQVDEFNAAWREMLQSPQKITVLPPQATRWNAAEYYIGVDSADDSHDWVYVQHLPCETDVYSGRDDPELYTADRLVETMMAHRCEGTADQAGPRSHDYPVGG